MSCRSDALYACLTNDLMSNRLDQHPFAIHFLKECFSKFRDDHTSEPDKHALEKFKASNSKCREFEGLNSLLFNELIRIIKFELLDLRSPELDDLYPEPGCFTPGSSYGVKNGNFLRKIGSKPTVTSKWLWGVYVQVARKTNLEFSIKDGFSLVPGNKLHFVPKNNESSRVIASEPIVNMYFQKKTENYLVRQLAARGIHLSTQANHNRKLARQGSIDGTLCTIDLSSASDSVSINLCKMLLPGDFFEWLMAIRSPFTLLPDGSLLENSMISSMGNATTFPLQTLIFLCICRAVARISDPKATISVFGDDIVVSTTIAHLVIRALSLFGFTPNIKKTFLTGSFRESCGGDYLSGRNIRPVYIRSLITKTDVYSAINRLVIWSARHQCPLDSSISYLRSLVSFNIVPLDESVDSGIRCLLSPSRSYRKNRYRAFVSKLKLDDLNHRAEVLLLGFLRGDIRDGVCFTRDFNCLSKTVYRYTTNWLRIDHSSTLLEDLDDNWYLCYLDYYFGNKEA